MYQLLFIRCTVWQKCWTWWGDDSILFNSNMQCCLSTSEDVCIINLILVTVRPVEAPRRPCEPSPCGSNAICRERNGAGSCSCQPQYFGDPYTGCRPECVLSSDCAKDRTCINNKCSDPCPGTCGLNAQCRVINHVPSCSCLPGYTGDSLRSCSAIPATRKNLF